MTDQTAPVVQMDESGKISGLEEALAAARESGFQAGRTDGYKAGRADAAAIMASDEAEGRGKLAAKLAGDADFTVEKARGWLQEAGQEASSSNYQDALKANAPPEPGPNKEPDPSNRQQRTEQLKKVGALVSGRN